MNSLLHHKQWSHADTSCTFSAASDPGQAFPKGCRISIFPPHKCGYKLSWAHCPHQVSSGFQFTSLPIEPLKSQGLLIWALKIKMCYLTGQGPKSLWNDCYYMIGHHHIKIIIFQSIFSKTSMPRLSLKFLVILKNLPILKLFQNFVNTSSKFN